MTKETMIWQTCYNHRAGYVVNKTLPIKEEFEQSVIRDVSSILVCTPEEIREVLNSKDCTQFAIVMGEIYKDKDTEKNSEK